MPWTTAINFFYLNKFSKNLYIELIVNIRLYLKEFLGQIGHVGKVDPARPVEPGQKLAAPKGRLAQALDKVDEGFLRQVAEVNKTVENRSSSCRQTPF